MRLSEREKEALREVFKDFEGEIYIFGSRLDDTKKGGDIDILLKPTKTLSFEDIIRFQAKYFSIMDSDIDIVVYDENNPFVKDIVRYAERVDLSGL